MPISLKTKNDIEKMKIAGNYAAKVLEYLEDFVQVGISTEEIDNLAYKYITEELKCIPANVGYNDYPKTLCTSINDVICHGIPSDKEILKDGDIVNIDITVIVDGWHGDTSKMFLIGKSQPHVKRLVDITRECMFKGIEVCKPGAFTGDIGYAIQTHAEKNHYSVVKNYCGHGIGKIYHEDPQITHFGNKGEGIKLEEGMVFTIEPMINLGSHKTKLLKDGWTVVTEDGKLSAQWEHTIAITEQGYEILTLREEEK
jgi:methionyl aminopeptidase